jgi:hypothetical protein
MAEIVVNGRIKVKTFQSPFLKSFPYLVPTLRMEDGKGIDNELTIAGARSKAKGEYKPSGESELSVNGNLTVGGFENRFKAAFGIDCEILYRKSSRHFRTNEEHDKMTLASLNKHLQETGAEAIEL